MSQTQTGVRLACFIAPSLTLSGGPQGGPTWGSAFVPQEDKNISLAIPGRQDAFADSERFGHYEI